MQNASVNVVNDSEAGRLKFEDRILEYTVISTDSAMMGGIPGRMTAVSSIVWDDQDKNRRLDRNEIHVSMYSKVATR